MKKRVLTLALVLCLTLSLAAPAMAAEESGYRVVRISDGRAMYLYSFTYANGGTLPTAVDCSYSVYSQTMAFNDAGQVTEAKGGIDTYTYAYDGDGNMTESLEENAYDSQTVTTRTVNTWEDGLLMSTQTEQSAVAVEGSGAPEFSSTVTDKYSYDGGVCTGRTRTTAYDGQERIVTIEYENDENGNPVHLTYSSETQASAEETFSYDEQGRVASHTATNGLTYAYTYADPVQVEVMRMELPEDDTYAAEVGGVMWNVSLQMADASGTVYFTDTVQTTGEPELVYDENGLLTALNCVYSGDSFSVAVEYETTGGSLVGGTVAMPDDGYAAPAELGTDPLSMIFEFDGRLYQLPAPFAAFAANGLGLMSDTEGQTVEPGASVQYDLGLPLLHDRYGSVLLHNYGSAPAAPEDCYVVAIGVNYFTESSPQLVVPEANGVLHTGMTMAEIDAIAGPSEILYYYTDMDSSGFPTADSSAAVYREYRAYLNEEDGLNDPGNYNIRIEYSYEQDAADYMQVYYEPDALPY